MLSVLTQNLLPFVESQEPLPLPLPLRGASDTSVFGIGSHDEDAAVWVFAAASILAASLLAQRFLFLRSFRQDYLVKTKHKK